MPHITITPTLRSAIYRAAKRHVSGANPLFEAGLREGRDGRTTPNMRLWAEDADLYDLIRLRDLKTVETDAEFLCELDLYATTGIGSATYGARELETNVYVTFNAHGVVKTSAV